MKFRPNGLPKRAAITVVAALLMAGGGATPVSAGGGGAATYPPRHAGPSGDGTAVTPVGHRVTPAGHQTNLGELPLHAVFFPDRRHVLVANAGDGVQSLQVVDATTSTVTQTISYLPPESLSTGLAFSPDGTHVYVSGGGSNKIRVFGVSGARLTEQAPIPLPATANLSPTGLAVTPDGARLVVADQLTDAATVVDLATGHTNTITIGNAPYAVALSKDGRTAYVTNQGGNTVSVLDVRTGTPALLATITVGTHPNQLVLDQTGRTLYVSGGDSDQISVLDTAANRVVKTISLAPYENAQVGTNPAGLTLSPDGRRLYVANSGNNDVAVIDLNRGRVAGLIPTAWYPTSVLATAERLFVLNAKGLGAGPNPDGPNPYIDYPHSVEDPRWRAQFVGTMMVGTLSTIPLLRDDGRQLAGWTRQVADNNGFALADRVRGTAGNSVVPSRIGGSTPIEHVIYVVKEARPYDQMLGNLGKGNGDPSLALFGDDSKPNHYALSNRFVTLDNFYSNADVQAQGWNWAVAANSNLYTQQTWVGRHFRQTHPTPSESSDPVIAPNRNPADAYLWDRLASKGVSFRNYGFYVTPDAAGKMRAVDPTLDANTNADYMGFNPNCPDSAGTFPPQGSECLTPRIEEWKREFAGYVANSDLPTVQFVRLPNDNTFGNWPAKPVPSAYIGDNDWALGQLVDAVSHSKYWASTAIFVTEVDAQAGADHVSAHRTMSLVISPYTQTGKVDSTFYSTVSMLRTIELIVGIKPLTQFDAYATPMSASFTNRPDFTPYAAVKPTTSFTPVNPPYENDN
ncbi:MAG: bifunctional YncE family protein/alkaline phosphatase family protein [Actinophytocola sp.]|uniref:bifunctional YncE family protein/alkaline phosphatase family protein n=1 Tax=Actinophytocola sp. TaxID=1872138 RepID=UPI003C77BC94